jgi:tight adherence protein B
VSEPQFLALAAALVLAAAALWLWAWSARERARQRAGAHLERQLRASDEAPQDNAPWMRAPARMPEAAAEQMPLAGAAPRRARWLPEWLDGAVSPGRLITGLMIALLAVAVAGIALGPLAAAGAAVICAALGAFALWLAVQRLRRRLAQQLPPFIDAMVRLITIGNSTQAAFQLSIANSAPPLREHLERAASLVRAGVDLDQALLQTARAVHVEEMTLMAAILGLSVRYGGRADLMLERVAHFMRDREQAEQELSALSSETRLSAWILGAGGLQVLGSILLYRLARLE